MIQLSSLVLYGFLAALAGEPDALGGDPLELENYARRMVVNSGAAAADAEQPPLPPAPTSRPATRTAASLENAPLPTLADIQEQIPDTEVERDRAQALMESATSEPERVKFRRIIERVESIRRPQRVRLSLQSALHRALANSYAIRIEGYNPAINTTQVVEAEAAFDAVFFLNLTKNKQNPPDTTNSTPWQIRGTNIDTLDLQGGFRKLLPTGMQMQTSLSYARTDTQLLVHNPAIIDPTHFTQFITEFRQPLLRGFGIDVNRAQIYVNRNDRRISVQAFEQRVRETLENVEQSYWRLVQARREVVITARLLAEFEQILDSLIRRIDFDAFPIQIADTRARLQDTRAQFVRVQENVRNAEYRLIAFMNDPELNLASDVEIVPEDFPTYAPLVVDRYGEVQTALENRSEIQQAKLRIENARILVGTAKNGVLPRLDLTFRYTVDGLGDSADDSFDQVTTNRYQEYFVGIQFEIPVGNRAPRAALRRVQLQWAQAVAALKQLLESIILETNVAVRELNTAYNQIEPNYQSARANQDQVRSIALRAERKDFPQLSQELSAHQALAASRSNLLSSLVDYNISIVTLERSKGTLLHYNNVFLPEEDVSGAPRK
ncbi:MAG TPA: TolC family protein [Phycisphaerae bacterium]